jgi:serine/threonine protein kinase/tetratricopeptide (TPR) repeat protein
MPIELATRSVRLVRRLGVGASAEVWAVASAQASPSRGANALTEEENAPWALKVGRPDTSRYLASEAERLALALAPQLPQALEVGRLRAPGLPKPEWSNAPYLLMTRVAGVTLSQVLLDFARADSRRSDRDTSIPVHLVRVHLARCVARDVGRALADLHTAGFGHGDLKPDNILVEQRNAEGDEPEFSCGVIDLGLSTLRGSEQVRGGTLHYLPPEVLASKGQASDAQSRDLWALGAILKEVTGPERTPSLKLLIDSLTAATPAARPRASWVAEQAGYHSSCEARTLTIRRLYLQAQRAFLRAVKDTGLARFDVSGEADTWLQATCQVLKDVRVLQNPSFGPSKSTLPAGPPPVAVDLSPHARMRFLMQVCGRAALDFPPLPPSGDGELLNRLVQAAQRHPLEAFTYDIISETAPNTSASAPPDDGAGAEAHTANPEDLLSLSLRLGADNPPLEVLAQCESVALDSAPPLPFVLRLSNAFKRRGELGRARALLLNRPDDGAKVALAGILARAGANDECLEMALPLRQSQHISVQGDATALCARVYLAQGELGQAGQVLRDLDDRVVGTSLESVTNTPAVLEAKASVALAQQDVEGAQVYLHRALGAALDPEQQARLEALVAYANHQHGSHETALRAYERATTAAARAGALLEEATYLVGVASNALPVGRIGDALQAAQRSLLLFEFLHNPSAAARAAFNQSCALVAAGAQLEAQSAIADTIARARAAKDPRCEGLAHLLASCDQEPHRALEHVERAEQLLAPLQASDRLRVAARRLSLASNDVDIITLDTLATETADIESRLEWWTARARHALATGLSDVAQTQGIVAALGKLANRTEPVEPLAQAFAAGAELAARRGEGLRSLQFVAVARNARRATCNSA